MHNFANEIILPRKGRGGPDGCDLRSCHDGVSSGAVQIQFKESKAVRHTVLALVIAAMVTPAYAQFNPNLAGRDIKVKTDADARQEKERESGYRSGVNKIPDGKAKTDPWGGVRNAGAGQTQPRSSAK